MERGVERVVLAANHQLTSLHNMSLFLTKLTCPHRSAHTQVSLS